MIVILDGNRVDVGPRRRGRFVRRATFPPVYFGWTRWFVPYTVYGRDGATVESGHIFWGSREARVADGRVLIFTNASINGFTPRPYTYHAEILFCDDDY